MRELGAEETRARMLSVVHSVTPEKMIADTRAVLHAVGSDPAAAPGAMVSVGYCMGARFALHAVSVLGSDVVAAGCIHPGAFVTDAPDSPHHDLATVRGELTSPSRRTTARLPRKSSTASAPRWWASVSVAPWSGCPARPTDSPWPTFPSTSTRRPSGTSSERSTSGAATSDLDRWEVEVAHCATCAAGGCVIGSGDGIRRGGASPTLEGPPA